jgi:mRNA-degrading endonuclease RelE of RelBE toxin-antitoxin system
MKTVQNYWTNESRLHCSGYRILVKVDNLNNVRRETSTTFRNNRRRYLKEKSNELETDSKTKIAQTYIEA